MYLKELYSHTKNLGMVAGLVAALCFSNIALASGTWYIQESGITESLRDVCFVDSLNGCVCGDEIILHTSDGGRTWQCQWQNKSPIPTRLKTIGFRNNLEGWAGGVRLECGNGALLLHTTDGGYSWDGQLACVKGTPPVQHVIRDIDFPNVSRGFYAHNWCGIPDCGSRIHQLPDKSTLIGWECINPSKICFPDTLHGWLLVPLRCSLSCFVFPIRLTDSSIEVPVERFFTTAMHDLIFVDTLKGWIVGMEGAIFHTTNGGFTWDSQMSGIANTFYAVDFVDSLNGWVVGAGGSILRTRNGGDSWIIEPSPTNADLYAVCFVDTNHGWAVGDNGTILCYTTGAVCVAETKAESSPNCGLFNIYPNPFNQKTKIEFTLNKELSMTLKIYNTSGRLTEILINREIGSGSHSIEWDAKDVSGGVYFCRLKASDYTEIRKMILVK